MRIKEVEKATGLTAKAIRLYESKGLLSVARESENDYRDYSEADVHRLQNIAVLRRLDIPVKEIKEWCDGTITLADLIGRAAYQARMAQEQEKAKVELSAHLLRMIESNPNVSLRAAIEDAEAMQALYNQLDDLAEQVNGNLLWPVYATVIALGPIGWTFFRIILGETKQAVWSLAISLMLIPVVCFCWYRYFQSAKEKRKAKGCLTALIVCGSGLVLAIGSVVFVSICQEWLFSPGSGLYLFRNPWPFVTLLFPILELLCILHVCSEEADRRESGNRGKWMGWLFLIGINLIVYYGCVTGVSFYADGAFTRHSIFCPTGYRYEVSDVAYVEAGFRGGLDALLPWNAKGDFYYEVTFSDGKTENWSELNALEEGAEDDPWQLLLELDKELMEAGVEKRSHWEHREAFSYDQSCLEIADQILNDS